MCGGGFGFGNGCGGAFLSDGIVQGQLDVQSAQIDALTAAVQTILLSGMSTGTTYGAFSSANGQQNEFVEIGGVPTVFDEALCVFEGQLALADQ